MFFVDIQQKKSELDEPPEALSPRRRLRATHRLRPCRRSGAAAGRRLAKRSHLAARDFGSDDATISEDLYEVLLAYQQLRRCEAA